MTAEPPVEEPRHCDAYVHDSSAPLCLRLWLLVHRLPAADQVLLREAGIWPRLFADYEGRRVRVVMASRLGDVGVTTDLAADAYQRRVAVAELSNFGDADLVGSPGDPGGRDPEGG